MAHLLNWIVGLKERLTASYLGFGCRIHSQLQRKEVARHMISFLEVRSQGQHLLVVLTCKWRWFSKEGTMHLSGFVR